MYTEGYIKDSPHICSRVERQPCLNIGEYSFSMEQEVESLVPVSNDYFIKFMGRGLVKGKRMQKAKMVVITLC